MRAVIRDSWLAFTEPLEGGVACFYNDTRGLTTIAYGNLCNTPGEAAALPLVHPDFSPASVSEKVAAWQAVHGDPRAASLGWRYAATLTPLRLTPDGMKGLALARLETNDRILRARLDNWEDLPACAQMAMHSLAWACGANVPYPRLFEDVRRGDFEAAAVEIHMNEWTPEGIHNTGIIPRNVANKLLMKNAAHVVAMHLDPDLLDWKHDLEVSNAPTLPSIENAASEPTLFIMPDNVGPAQERDPDEG